MKVALTGATGFIGSHVLAELQQHGHEVTALVRDDAQAEAVAARGVTPAVVDLYDRPAVVSVLSDADGAIHTASPGDETSADLDSAVVAAAIEAFDGTGTPYLGVGAVGLRGQHPHHRGVPVRLARDGRVQAADREAVARRENGLRGVVIVSGVAHRRRRGRGPRAARFPRDDAGNLIMLGAGQQHWSTVHAADLADFFRRVLVDDSARGYYVVGDGRNPTVAEITEAAAVATGAPGAVAGSDEEARARFGDYFAEVLLLDQGTDAARARAEFGWRPSHKGLVDEFRNGSYRKQATNA